MPSLPSSIRGRRTDQALLLLPAVLAAIAGVVYMTGSAGGPAHAWRGLPLDDSWIHLVYARSIAQGQPFQYNPGQPETGSTSPLWALLLSPGILFGLPPAIWAKALGVLLAAAVGVVGWRYLRSLGFPGAGIVFAACLPLLPNLAFASVSGTEVHLFALLMLSTTWAAVRGSARLAGLLAGLTMLARPEGVVLAGLLFPALAWRAWRRKGSGPARIGRRLLTEAIVPLLLAIVVVLPWMSFCLSVTGRPLPSTFYAKAAWFGLYNSDQLRRISAVLLDQPFLGAALGVSALRAAGAVVGLGLVGAGLAELWRRDRAALFLAGGLPFALLYAQSAVVPQGEILAPDETNSVRNFYFVRYLLPAVPLLLVLWSIGFARLTGWGATAETKRGTPFGSSGRRRGLSRSARSRGAVAAGLLALPLASAIAQHAALRDVYSWNCQNIEGLQVRAAKWIAQNLPEGASVGVSDAGALRYFGGRRVVDLAGLNAHRLLPLLAQINASPPAGPREAELRARFWREERLSHLAITNGWHLPLVRGRPFDGLAVFRLERNTICAQPELIVVKDREY